MIIVLKQDAPTYRCAISATSWKVWASQINDSKGSDTRHSGPDRRHQGHCGELGAGKPGGRDLPPRVRAL